MRANLLLRLIRPSAPVKGSRVFVPCASGPSTRYSRSQGPVPLQASAFVTVRCAVCATLTPAFFIRVPPDVLYLQFCTPKVVALSFKLHTVYIIYK
jgi:hypothetical protein